MEYVLLRYRDRPADPTALLSTADPARAAGLVRAWRREHPDEGLIATVEATAVIHCPPRASSA